MKINVHFSFSSLDELYFTGKTSVVIDVLRASTVIVTALAGGAREIIPVSTLDFAMKVSGDAFRSQTLLGGERNTKMVEGFNLGNSPLEYKSDVIAGKSIILYTTNGSKAIVKAKFSENLFVACFNNLGAVANHLVSLNKDVEILCAGTNGAFNLEDSVCAGKIVAELKHKVEDARLSDSALAAVTLFKSYGKNLLKLLKSTEHGRLLIENGFLEDIKYCAKLDTTDVIPYYSNGVLKRVETSDKII